MERAHGLVKEEKQDSNTAVFFLGKVNQNAKFINLQVK